MDLSINVNKKLKLYYIATITSLIFAVLSFSYNTWRLEQTEENSSIREAAFSVLVSLSEFEQIIFAGHYDLDTEEGSPRKAWAKIALITDLSFLIDNEVEQDAEKLKELWQLNWQLLGKDEEQIKQVLTQVDNVRASVKKVIRELD